MLKKYDIRGLYPKEINESVAIFLIKKFLEFLKKKIVYKNCLLIAQDIRNSSYKIANTLINYLKISKIQHKFLGIVPTPIFYYFCLKDNLPGVMITASHLPLRYNGFKFFLPDNKIWIYRKKIKTEIVKKEKKSFTDINYVNNKIYEDYLNYLKKFIKLKDIHNFYFLEKAKSSNNFLFSKIPNVFKNITLSKNSDIILSSDYDGDRLFIKYKKRNLTPEEILFIILSSGCYKNVGLTLSIHKNIKNFFPQIKFYTIKTGHSNIKKSYKKYNLDFALEPSGHFYFFKEVKTECPILSFFRLLEFIESKKNKDIKFYHLFPLKRFNIKDYNFVEKIKNYINKNKFKIKKFDGLYCYKKINKKEYLGIHLRQSETEKSFWRVFIESNNLKNIKNIMLKLKSQND